MAIMIKLCFREAGQRIAMGNGVDILKEKATYITDTVDNEGIYKALKHYELLLSLKYGIIIRGRITMKQKTDFQTFISYFKPHRRLFFLDLACALMISLIDLAFPFVSRWCMYTLLPNSIYKTFLDGYDYLLIRLFSTFILYLYNFVYYGA